MNYFKMNGVAWDVVVTGISRSFEIRQSDNAGATLAPGAPEVLDPLGTFIGHTVTVKRRRGKEAVYDALWDFVTQPRTEPIEVEAAYNQTTIKYKAKVSSGGQDLLRIDPNTGKEYWGELVINIEPTEAQFVI